MKPTLYWTRLHSSMVPFEIDIKLSAINSKVLNVLIARKETRRPCCRREQPRDVGQLYRKLAPDPLVTQWTERPLKLSETWGSCRKTTFQVYQWRIDTCRRMVSRDLQIKVDEIRGISFDWPHLTRPNFVVFPHKSVRSKRWTCSFAMKQKAVHIGL